VYHPGHNLLRSQSLPITLYQGTTIQIRISNVRSRPLARMALGISNFRESQVKKPVCQNGKYQLWLPRTLENSSTFWFYNAKFLLSRTFKNTLSASIQHLRLRGIRWSLSSSLSKTVIFRTFQFHPFQSLATPKWCVYISFVLSRFGWFRSKDTTFFVPLFPILTCQSLLNQLHYTVSSIIQS